MIELINRFGIIPGIKKKYLIDSPEELTELDTTFGNEAYCIGDTKTYICNGSGIYVEKKVASGGEDKKLYQHCISINRIQTTDKSVISVNIINDSPTLFTYAMLKEYLITHEFLDSKKPLMAIGISKMTNNVCVIAGIYLMSNIMYSIRLKPDSTTTDYAIEYDGYTVIADTVIEL